MRLIFLVFILGHACWRLIRSSCWLRLRRHQPAWIQSFKPGVHMRVCVECERPLFPFVRRAK